MHVRRVALTLSILVALLSSLAGGPLALASTPLAQTGVDDAEDAADQAGARVDEAYRVVSDAVANRDRIEGRLFDALLAYDTAAQELSAANSRLDRVTQKLAILRAQALDLEAVLAEAAVNAYVEAVGGAPSLMLAGTGADSYLFASQVLHAVQGETRSEIDQVSAFRNELTSLELEFENERNEVESRSAELAARASELESLFAEADGAVAAAYSAALDAEAAYRHALTDVEAARAAREAEERRSSAGTTTTQPPSGGVSGTSSTTTTTTGGGGGGIKIGPAVEAWRPKVAQHFPPALVEEALQIMQCESAGDPNAVNPYSGAAGLFQFLPGTWAVASVQAGVGEASVFDGEANIIAAAWLAGYYQSRGYSPWQPWTCRFYL